MSLTLNVLRNCIFGDAGLTQLLCSKLQCSVADLISVLRGGSDSDSSNIVVAHGTSRRTSSCLLEYPVEVMTQVLQYLDLRSLSRMDVAISHSSPLRFTFLACLRSPDITVDVDWELYKSTTHAANPHLLTFFDWMISRQVCWSNLTISKSGLDPNLNNYYHFEKLLRHKFFNRIQEISFVFQGSDPASIDLTWEAFGRLCSLILNACASSIKVLNLCLPLVEERAPMSLPLLGPGFLMDLTPFYPKLTTSVECLRVDGGHFIGGGFDSDFLHASVHLSSLLNELQSLKELHIFNDIPDWDEMVVKPLVTKLHVYSFDTSSAFIENLLATAQWFPNLQTCFLRADAFDLTSTTLDSGEPCSTETALISFIKHSPHLQALTIELRSGEDIYIMNIIESIFRTLSEMKHQLSKLSIAAMSNKLQPQGDLARVFAAFPNNSLTSLSFQLLKVPFDKESALTTSATSFPNARVVLQNEFDIFSSWPNWDS